MDSVWVFFHLLSKESSFFLAQVLVIQQNAYYKSGKKFATHFSLLRDPVFFEENHKIGSSHKTKPRETPEINAVGNPVKKTLEKPFLNMYTGDT